MNYPDMIKTSARYRGPVESEKMNRTIRDVSSALSSLQKLFIENKKRVVHCHEEIHEASLNKMPIAIKKIEVGINKLKRGET